ncbi:hypothetical protein BP00DRAFT_64459 [Aspergillus indologenus CBS 114.80]|uniref:Uncharacterized protein n=1 Tax=Aspergillus indologenus CBS 114.80 TaxID=1450541 RepID=A0A2V5ICZ6_9EURO|nr:hypothetical protein BP00DRAFT_64459 [Aspergillus indologenus CBS 114.80]
MDLTIGSPLRGRAYPWLILSSNLGYTEWDPRPSWRQLFEPGTYTPVIYPPLLLLILLIHFLFILFLFHFSFWRRLLLCYPRRGFFSSCFRGPFNR